MDEVRFNVKLNEGFQFFSGKWRYLWSVKLKDNFFVLKEMSIPS